MNTTPETTPNTTPESTPGHGSTNTAENMPHDASAGHRLLRRTGAWHRAYQTAVRGVAIGAVVWASTGCEGTASDADAVRSDLLPASSAITDSDGRVFTDSDEATVVTPTPADTDQASPDPDVDSLLQVPASSQPSAPLGAPTLPAESFPGEFDGDEPAADDHANPDEFAEPNTARLYVSNQSFEVPQVDMRIEVDGELVVDQEFDVGDQHNWITFDVPHLDPGNHVLTVSADGASPSDTTFVITADAAAYIVVDYWISGPTVSIFADPPQFG